MAFSGLREAEFEVVLADLMQGSDKYVNVQLQSALKSSPNAPMMRADITATEQATSRSIVVECKSYQTITSGRLKEAVAQLRSYPLATEDGDRVLAMPARLSPDQKKEVADTGVQVWDLDEIVVRFGGELEHITHPVLRPLLLATRGVVTSRATLSEEARLLQELRDLPPGTNTWPAYQKLIGRILERLFCPPLSTPILERRDQSGTNRRDIILPNYSEGGFWAFVRERYAADFVLVDAKNYTGQVGKDEALQILNYLKPEGVGLLGFIICRTGYDAACEVTIRDSWTRNGKLLIILTDEHLERMLNAKETGGPPEDVVRQWIEDFRIAM